MKLRCTVSQWSEDLFPHLRLRIQRLQQPNLSKNKLHDSSVILFLSAWRVSWPSGIASVTIRLFSIPGMRLFKGVCFSHFAARPSRTEFLTFFCIMIQRQHPGFFLLVCCYYITWNLFICVHTAVVSHLQPVSAVTLPLSSDRLTGSLQLCKFRNSWYKVEPASQRGNHQLITKWIIDKQVFPLTLTYFTSLFVSTGFETKPVPL